MWSEKAGAATVEWRGKVQRMADGETLYFRDWSDPHGFVLEVMTALDIQPIAQNQPGTKPDLHDRDEGTQYFGERRRFVKKRSY